MNSTTWNENQDWQHSYPKIANLGNILQYPLNRLHEVNGSNTLKMRFFYELVLLPN